MLLVWYFTVVFRKHKTSVRGTEVLCLHTRSTIAPRKAELGRGKNEFVIAQDYYFAAHYS